MTSNDTNNLVLWEHQKSHLANEVEQDLGANIATTAPNGTILDGDLDYPAPGKGYCIASCKHETEAILPGSASFIYSRFS